MINKKCLINGNITTVIIAVMVMTTMMMIPILVTLVGIITDVSDVHESKACKPNSRGYN